MTRQEIRDWRQRIIEAEERFAGPQRAGGIEGFNAEDIRDAQGWSGCAVGEYFARASRTVKVILAKEALTEGFDFWAGPDDRVLQRLGGEFAITVENNNFLRAYEIIDLIEARALELRYRKAS